MQVKRVAPAHSALIRPLYDALHGNAIRETRAETNKTSSDLRSKNMNKSTIAVCALAVACTVGMSGCASMGSSADIYDSMQTQHEETVRMATVESVRGVTIENNDVHPAPFGAIGGGLLGAVAGSAVGEGHGSLLAGVIGGIAGAVAGDQIQDHLERQKGLEITVRLDNGDLRAITQAADGQMFYAGQRVRLLSSGGITRVTA
ncbi:outer membrane lipoprotein [Burkholderia sp. SJ98]|jgi:outer membrane lipoprotein SlyB|nr:outer membrane lipoprotein [Burkholderia sp. SJ98]